MEAELKEKWITALLSGEYKQGYGVLRSIDNEFCCIGVLCNIINPSQWVEGSIGNRRAYQYWRENRYSYACLPGSVDILTDNDQTILAELNDDEHRTFEEIVQWIRENV